MKLICALYILSVAAVWPVSASLTVTDNFDDDSTDQSKWSVYNVGSGLTVTEQNGRVEVSIASDARGTGQSGPTYGPNDFGVGYITRAQVSGDFDAQVDFSLLAWPLNNGVRTGTGLDLFFTAGERVSFSPSDYAGFVGDYYLTHFLDGVQGLTPTTDRSGRLRVTRVGNLMSGYYWNGQSWVLIHQGPGPTGEGHVSIVAWSSDSAFRDQTVTVAFDNFSVTSSGEEVAPVPEPSTWLAGILVFAPFVAQVLRSSSRGITGRATR